MIKDFLIYTAFLKSKGVQFAKEVYSDYSDQWYPDEADVEYLEKIASDNETYIQVGFRFRDNLDYLLETETNPDKLKNLISFAEELKMLANSDDYRLFQVSMN